MLQLRVTYSTPIGQSLFFNIDAGGEYVGGFLDGFEIGSLGATEFDVKITFADGSQQGFNYPYPESPGFFGFLSDAQDIASVAVGCKDGFFGFDFDNFTFDTVHGEECAPHLDGNGVLGLFDYLAFTNLFNAGDPQADFDVDGTLDPFDFLAFTNAFNSGC